MPEYLNYWLNSAVGVAALRALATPGVSQFNINPTALRRNIRLPLPSLPEQEAIVEVVELCDRRVRATRFLSRAKSLLKRGLMERLLSGRRRLVGFSANWTEHRLGTVFTERSESGRGDLPLLSITADRGVIRRDELDRRDSSNADKTAYLRIAPGDIGYNTMRMWQGVSGISSLEGIVSPAYTVCIPNREVDGLFAAHYFKHPPIVNLFRRHSQGLVDDTLNLKFHHFSGIRLSFPPIEEQRAISELLSLLDREILLLDQLATTLDRQKRSILGKLLLGEVAVPVP